MVGKLVDGIRTRPNLKFLNSTLTFLTGNKGGYGRTGLGISGGFAFANQDNNVQAIIGAGADVESTNGDLTVESSLVEFPKLYTKATTNNKAPVRDANNIIVSKADTRDNSIAVALQIGTYNNVAKAIIGDGATVNVGRDLNVVSSIDIPWEQQWWTRFSITPTFGGAVSEIGEEIYDFALSKINFNLGIQDGFFTSWTEAYAASQKRREGYKPISSRSTTITRPALVEGVVTVGRDASVVSTVENDTVNFAGQFGFFFPVPRQTATVGKASEVRS